MVAPDSSRSARLIPYAGATDVDIAIEATLVRAAGGMLTVSYRVEGNLRRLRVPPPAPPRFVDRLWQHTCFEVFLRHGASPGYHEFNFSPSGEWAIYGFERYRSGAAPTNDALAPNIAIEIAASTLNLTAGLSLTDLSPIHNHAELSVGLSAVIEDAEGALSYWALAHPSSKPDFHHPDSFALHLS